MPCMECEDTGRVECGQNLDDLCGFAGSEEKLGVAYVPVGIGSLYLGVDVWVDKDDNGECQVFLVRHCSKQTCEDDDQG